MLALVGLALAHSPHDMVRALGVQSGHLVVEQDERVARSVDAGDTILHQDAPAGAPLCIAPVTGSASAFVLVGAGGTVVRTADDGATWGDVGLSSATACAAGLDGALVAMRDGVARVRVDSVEAVAPVGALQALAEGAAVWAIDGEGALVRLDGDVATVIEPGPFRAIAAGPGVLLRGGERGVEVSRDEGETWAFTLDLPAAVLAAGPAAWLATTAEEGVWVSRDQGGSWLQVSAGLEPLATGSGGPHAGEAHWYALADDGGTLWAAAWEGLYRLRPGETWWREIETRALPLVRSIQWTDAGLLTAPYGGGLALGTPGADDWIDAAPDLGWPWLRQVLATEGGAGRWWMVGGQHIYATDDAGATVFVTPTGANLDGDAVLVTPDWPADPRVWAGGLDADQTGLALESPDAGETWTWARLEGCGTKPDGLVLVGGAPVVACHSGLWRRDTTGWIPWANLGEGITSLLPDGDGLLVGTTGGLWRVGAGEPERRLATPVDALARLGAGAVLAATADGLVHVDDGVALGWPTDDVVVTLEVDSAGRIAAGGYSGAWVSDDDGATWLLATDWDRFDDADTSVYYADGWAAVVANGAKADAVHVGGPGATLTWRVYGARLAVHAGGEGQAELWIDGADVGSLTVAGGAVTRVWEDDVELGWHELTLTVVAGSVRFDGGERWRTPRDEGPVEEAPKSRCGCEAGPVGRGIFAWGAGALLVLRRRARPRVATSS